MTTSQITASMMRRHWLPLKRRRSRGDVRWLSTEGMIILCSGRFPSDSEVTVNIDAPDHKVGPIPARIVRAEPAGNGTRYSLRFQRERIEDLDPVMRLIKYLAKDFSARDA